MNPCENVQNQLGEYLADELAPEQTEVLDHHLQSCSSCRGELQGLREMVTALDCVAFPKVRVDVNRIYQDALARQMRGARNSRRLFAGLSAAAAILLFVLLFRIQVHVQAEQIVVRWGPPPTQQDKIPPEKEKPKMEMQEPPRQFLEPTPPVLSASEVALLRELIHTLAAEVDRLDRKQSQDLELIRAQLAQMQRIWQERWEMADRHLSTSLPPSNEPKVQGDFP